MPNKEQTLEDASLYSSMLEALAMMSTPERITIAALASAHPQLVEDLRQFDLIQVLLRVAGLLTCIEYHPNTLRLEVLGHLALAHARGTRTPRRRDFDRWLNKWLQQNYVSDMEDPVEDAFITNVLGPDGNYRLFDGVWEANDYYLQDTMDVLEKGARSSETTKGVWQRIRALLLVSEAVVARTGLNRYTMSTGKAKKALALPSDERITQLASRVVLSEVELRRLPFDRTLLEPLIHQPGDSVAYNADRIGHSSLEAAPLLAVKGGLALALPTAVSVAVRRHVVAEMRRLGQLEQFKSVLRLRQLTRVANEAMPHLDPQPSPIEPPPQIGQGRDFFDTLAIPFDVDKLALFVLVHADPEQILEEGLTAPYALTAEQQTQLESYLRTRVAQFAAIPGCAAGLVVMCLGGIGQAWYVPLPEIDERWHYVTFNMADLMTVAWSEVASLIRLYKLKNHAVELRRLGISLHCPNGDLNLFSFWRAQGYRLIPNDLPVGQRAALAIATDFLTAFRSHVRQGHDTHVVLRPLARAWVPVKHMSLEYLFDESALSRAYVSFGHAIRGSLLGVVKSRRRAWWLSITPQTLSANADFAYRIWEGMLSWLERSTSALDRVDRGIHQGAVEIVLNVTALQALPQSASELPAVIEEPRVRPDPETHTVEVELPLGFFKAFQDPTNAGEGYLLSAVFTGVSQLGSSPLPPQNSEQLARRVLAGNDARFIHAPNARRWREEANDLPLPKMRLVQQEDLGRVSVDIGLLSDRRDTPISVREECNAFLNKAVDQLWETIRASLVRLDRRNVLVYCLENHEAVARDRGQWRLSSRALLALYGDTENVHAIAAERESRRNATALAMRCLSEMALSTCPESGGSRPSIVDMDELAARATLLIEIAHDSDAIRAGWSAPRIEMTPSGRVNIDRTFFTRVVVPYTQGHFSAMFDAAVENYPKRYEEPRTPTAEREKELDDLDKVFQTEHGFSIANFGNAIRQLGEMALSREQVVFVSSHHDVMASLGEAGLDVQEREAFLNRFALKPRRQWDEPKPVNAEPKDWYPWRFRRRLSLINRPIIALSAASDSDVLVAPGLLEDGARRLLQGLGEALRQQRRKRGSADAPTPWGKRSSARLPKYLGKQIGPRKFGYRFHS
jgi:hypothetical protein